LSIPEKWFANLRTIITNNPGPRVFTYVIKSCGKYSKVLTTIQEFEKMRLLTQGKLTGCIPVSSFVVKREIFQDYGFFREQNRGADVEFMSRLFCQHEPIEKIHFFTLP
jgi:hypothetical protein